MKTLISQSRYLSLIAVITLLLTFVLALLWSVAKAVAAGYYIVSSYGQSPAIALTLINVVDSFLIAIVLFLLAASIYGIFIGDSGLPARLVARDLPGLKSKLSGVVILVMAVRFAEILFEAVFKPLEILYLGLATAAVAGVLIAFSRFAAEESAERPDKP